MATEAREKQENGANQVVEAYPYGFLYVMLRVLALGATVSATLVMALNKESKNMVIGLNSNGPIYGTLTAKFQHTPAFVFFVIVNATASLHNFLALLLTLGSKVGLFASKFKPKVVVLMLTLSDMGIAALVAGGAGAASSISEVGKKGNKYARWNKICDRFGTFCDYGGGALIVSFIGVALLMCLNLLSTLALYKNHPNQPPKPMPQDI